MNISDDYIIDENKEKELVEKSKSLYPLLEGLTLVEIQRLFEITSYSIKELREHITFFQRRFFTACKLRFMENHLPTYINNLTDFLIERGFTLISDWVFRKRLSSIRYVRDWEEEKHEYDVDVKISQVGQNKVGIDIFTRNDNGAIDSTILSMFPIDSEHSLYLIKEIISAYRL